MGKERPPNKPAFFSTGSELTGPPQTKWPITSASAETSPHDIINSNVNRKPSPRREPTSWTCRLTLPHQKDSLWKLPPDLPVYKAGPAKELVSTWENIQTYFFP